MAIFLIKAESNVSIYTVEAKQFIETTKQYFLQLNCHHFNNFIGAGQKAQRILVNKFQDEVMQKLTELTPQLTVWEKEKSIIDGHKDRADLMTKVCLDGLSYKVIIEFDKPRADQVAKKFLSRTVHTLGEPSIYFAICYTGTKHMNIKEVSRYLNHCCTISNALSTENAPRIFVGIILENIPTANT